MNIITTPLADVLIIEPQIFADERGFFMESFNLQSFTQHTGLQPHFVQDNHSCSQYGVLRGLHYQIQQAQAKLVRVIVGEVFDVAVDMRVCSPTFGQWFGLHLSAQNKKQLWIPQGFAHGFLTLSEQAEVVYKTTDYYAPQYERCVLWRDEQLNIQWPFTRALIISAKDQQGVAFNRADVCQ